MANGFVRNLAGVDPLVDPAMDGVSLLPVLQGKPG
jgi:hypothetical protein